MSAHTLHLILLGTAGPAGVALVMGAVILWDRLLQPRRALTRPFAVVDARTYRDARKRIERLLDAGNVRSARFGMHACRVWLRREVQTGPRRRRVRRARDLEQIEMMLEQADPAMTQAVSGQTPEEER